MSDSQWPRFEVFIQERADRPHQNAGSVHAPDAEMALLNARDIFVRRPPCLSLWVAPAEAILARSAQEVADEPASNRPAQDEAGGELEPYAVFQKRSQRNTMSYVAYRGQVDATSPQAALAQARRAFDDGPAYVWWVCPLRAISRSDDDDVASMFDPAASKAYRRPQDYRVARELLAIKLSQRDEEEDPG